MCIAVSESWRFTGFVLMNFSIVGMCFSSVANVTSFVPSFIDIKESSF